jgi:hypothetical protein
MSFSSCCCPQREPSLISAGIQASLLFPFEKLLKQLFLLIVHRLVSARPLPLPMRNKAGIAGLIATADVSGSRG